MPKVAVNETPQALLPFIAHGVDFSSENQSGQAIGTCPFCGTDRKLYVSEETGEFKCFDCGEKGNAITFLRRIHELGTVGEELAQQLRTSRGILNQETLDAWGINTPLTSRFWGIPGYSAVSREITQIYRYLPDPKTEKMRLIATTGLPHGLFGVNLFDDNKSDVYITEGPWDGMVLQETLANAKQEADGSLIYTPNQDISLLTTSNVLSVPGCKVFNDSWCSLLAGKRVFLMYDNDHPREVTLKNGNKHMLPSDALEGMKTVANILSHSENPPAEVKYLKWGVDDLTYDPSLKHGYDVRDTLIAHSSLSERVRALSGLMKKFQPVPSEWLGGKTFKDGVVRLESLECTSWRDLTMTWRKAAKWTPGLERALAVMLSSAMSTGHVGDQLWVKIISCASSGKTMLCEAISVAREYVLPLSTNRGFHSGYKSDKEGTADHSLIPLLRGKTMVTKDGDTLLSSPTKDVTLSEGRDLYDRVSRSHYKNGINRSYEDVSMTWILCGTAGLRTLDSSELGERFLSCSIMDEIDSDLERSVVRRSVAHLLENRGTMVNGTAESRETPAKTQAKRMTGGYVEYLRKNATRLYQAVEFPVDCQEMCMDYGEFVAHMRARPSKKQEEIAEREFSVRLSNQLTLLALSLAAVLNRKQVDEVVMGHVQKVALDTARGRTLDLVTHLARVGEKGAGTESLAIWTGKDEEKEKEMLRFLKQIKVVELFVSEISPGVKGQPKWRLTQRMRKLYETCIPKEV